MYIVVIAWMFVVLTMSAAEAISSQGSLLGALFTFLLYGLLPLSIVLYVMGTPARRRRRRAIEAQQASAAATPPGDPPTRPPASAPRDSSGTPS